MSPRDLVEIVLWLEEVFDEVGLRRSYGGAIAYNYYGPPRLTRDVDVLVLLERTKAPALVQRLAAAGCVREAQPTKPVELRAFLDDLDGKGRFTVLRCFGVRVEVFLPWLPFHRRVLDRSPTRRLAGRDIAIHAAEDLIVFKKIFDRPKDLQDIRGILLANRGKLDLSLIRDEAKDLLPAPSLAELEEMLREA